MSLIETKERLLRLTAGCREDMHEPGQLLRAKALELATWSCCAAKQHNC
jgi:hypothetical protein